MKNTIISIALVSTIITTMFLVGCTKKENAVTNAGVETNVEASDVGESNIGTNDVITEEVSNTNNSDTNAESVENVEVTDSSPEKGDWAFSDAREFSYEMFDAYATEGWQRPYKEILDNMCTHVGDANYGEYNFKEYALYDINKDDIPELIIKYGSCQADLMTSIYSFNGSNAFLAGELPSGNTSYYTYPNVNGMVAYFAHMGYASAHNITLKNGKAEESSNTIFEDDLYDRLKLDMDAEYIKTDTMISGAEYIDMDYIGHTYGLLAYKEPLFVKGEKTLSQEGFRQKVDKVLQGQENFYAVKAQPIFDEDIEYFNGERNMRDILDSNTIFQGYDSYTGLEGVYYGDFNGDGNQEAVAAYLAGDSVAFVLFSYQNDTMYGYFTNPIFDCVFEIDNGKIDICSEYQEGEQLVFEYCLDQCSLKRIITGHRILSKQAKYSLKLFRQDVQGEKGELAVSFLGWAGTYSGTYMYDVLSGAAEIYRDEGFMRELNKCKCVKLPGEEVYLLVPAKEEYSMTIYERLWGENTADGMPMRGEILYKAEPGEIVVVRGNQSDIVSNIEVTMDIGGQEFVYNPELSLENGRLSASDNVVDFSRYEPEEY